MVKRKSCVDNNILGNILSNGITNKEGRASHLFLGEEIKGPQGQFVMLSFCSIIILKFTTTVLPYYFDVNINRRIKV